MKHLNENKVEEMRNEERQRMRKTWKLYRFLVLMVRLSVSLCLCWIMESSFNIYMIFSSGWWGMRVGTRLWAHRRGRKKVSSYKDKMWIVWRFSNKNESTESREQRRKKVVEINFVCGCISFNFRDWNLCYARQTLKKRRTRKKSLLFQKMLRWVLC